jgi:hypothetical protein
MKALVMGTNTWHKWHVQGRCIVAFVDVSYVEKQGSLRGGIGKGREMIGGPYLAPYQVPHQAPLIGTNSVRTHLHHPLGTLSGNRYWMKPYIHTFAEHVRYLIRHLVFNGVLYAFVDATR